MSFGMPPNLPPSFRILFPQACAANPVQSNAAQSSLIQSSSTDNVQKPTARFINLTGGSLNNTKIPVSIVPSPAFPAEVRTIQFRILNDRRITSVVSDADHNLMGYLMRSKGLVQEETQAIKNRLQ